MSLNKNELDFRNFRKKLIYKSFIVLFIISNAVSHEAIFRIVEELTQTTKAIIDHFKPEFIWDSIAKAFEKQKLLYNKTYVTQEEQFKRFEIFTKSCLDFLRHNLLAQLGLVSYETGINQFSDMTKEEVLQSFGGFSIDLNFLRNRFLNQTFRFHREKRKADKIPDNWDWRDFKIVAPIKNQGSCDSCWAFAANSALESHMMKAQLCQNKKFDTISLSEQNLIDCSKDYGNTGCDGGLMSNAYNYIEANGVMASDDYPYIEDDGQKCQYKSDKKVGSCNGYVEVEPNDEEALQHAVYQKGPVCSAVYVTDDFIKYRSGIFDDTSCPHNTGEIHHAVCIVGYGKTADNIEYWIIRNSWGESWGEDGYFRLRRNKNNTCNVASYCLYPLVDNSLDTDKSWMAKPN